jgi:hypothetical protein
MLVFSVEYYVQISVFFGVFVALLEVVKVFYVSNIDYIKVKKLKVLMLFICLLITLFSIFGSVSNSYNMIMNSNNKNYKTIVNSKYTKYQKTKDLKTSQLTDYKKQLDSFPTIDVYIANIPKWQPDVKQSMTDKYNTEKQKIQDKIDTLNNDIIALQEPDKMITIKKNVNTGYLPIMIKLENMIHIKAENIILLLILFLSLIIEMIIYTSSFIQHRLQKQNIDNVNRFSNENIQNVDKVNKISNKNMLDNSMISNDNMLNVDKVNRFSNENMWNIDNKINDIKDFLAKTYQPKQRIKKFMSDFNLSEYEYKIIRDRLKQENFIYTENKNMYLSNKLICIGGVKNG